LKEDRDPLDRNSNRPHRRGAFTFKPAWGGGGGGGFRKTHKKNEGRSTGAGEEAVENASKK